MTPAPRRSCCASDGNVSEEHGPVENTIGTSPCLVPRQSSTPLVISTKCSARATGAAERELNGRRQLFAALALVLAAPIFAETHVRPAVQPGGDIPPNFHPLSGRPTPPRAATFRSISTRRVRIPICPSRGAIPMRDGMKLYTVLIIPRGAAKLPIMLDRTPYSADKARPRRFRSTAGEHPLAAYSELSARAISSRSGRPRQVQVRRRVCDEPTLARSAQPDEGRSLH